MTTPMIAYRSLGSRDNKSVTAGIPPADAPITATSRAINSSFIGFTRPLPSTLDTALAFALPHNERPKRGRFDEVPLARPK